MKLTRADIEGVDLTDHPMDRGKTKFGISNWGYPNEHRRHDGRTAKNSSIGIIGSSETQRREGRSALRAFESSVNLDRPGFRDAR
jgi:hypothetical protein